MAAGLGFKTFTTGEVLTADNVNGYLMQGILVFANSTARDAAITSPQEGQFAYLKDTNVTTYYTGSAWAASTSGSNFTLLNSGGTALTGAATITVSGLSGYDKFLVLISAASSANANAFVNLRLNTDTGGNYYGFGAFFIGETSYNQNNLQSVASSGATSFNIGRLGTTATDSVSGSIVIQGANSTGQKVVTVLGTGSSSSGGQRGFTYSGRYDSSSVISSISAFSDSGNFDAGTMFIYGSVA